MVELLQAPHWRLALAFSRRPFHELGCDCDWRGIYCLVDRRTPSVTLAILGSSSTGVASLCLPRKLGKEESKTELSAKQETSPVLSAGFLSNAFIGDLPLHREESRHEPSERHSAWRSTQTFRATKTLWRGPPFANRPRARRMCASNPPARNRCTNFGSSFTAQIASTPSFFKLA